MTLAAPYKTGITEYYSSEGAWPKKLTDMGIAIEDKEGASETESGANPGNSVSKIAISGGGDAVTAITVTYNSKVAADATVVLTPADGSGAITWECTYGGKMDPAWVPTTCRDDGSE
ncbi:pilin [Cobetia sp. BMC6]|nr:pilin [Cobetia sp. BMC6]